MKPHLPSVAQLLALGLAAGALWRLEVELHGWEGLLWLGYPHLAVPAGAALFLAWVLRSPLAPTGRRRVGFALYAALYAAVALGGLEQALTLAFGFADAEDWAMLAGSPLRTFLFPAVTSILAAPLGAFLLATSLGVRLAWPLLPVSVALAALAGPAAVAALSVLDPNHADGIHAVKTGAAVPFAVWGLGVPWVFRRSPKRPTGSPAAVGG